MTPTLRTAVLAASVLTWPLVACRPAADPPAASAPATVEPAADPAPPEVALEHYTFGGDFVLTNAALGRSSRLSDLKGKVVLLFFGYTSCPDACPLTMSKITRAIAMTPGAKDQVETVFITVDVDRDSPETLARYVTSWSVPVTGFTGTRAEVDAVVAQYKASYTITPSDSAGGPTVSHSVYTYLIDRTGALRKIFRFNDPAETLAAGLAAALKLPA